MSCLAPFTSFFQITKRKGQGAISCGFQWQSRYTTSIHILDDESLLNIFYLYRPCLLGEEEEDVNISSIAGRVAWSGERWWYRLAHVCHRWRNLILGSASYLSLCLVCTYRTPLADMLAHSPPLPLVIDFQYYDINAEDEETIILALQQRDRVRRIRFNHIPALNLQKLITAVDGEFPILQYLILGVRPKEKRTVLILPETLQTPHLRHLSISCSIPVPFQFLATAVGLVKLYLGLHHPSTYYYFQPAVLLQSLSLMPQLEVLVIFFRLAVPNRDVEWQLMHTPIIAHITLPNLRSFVFQAVSAYSEAVLSRITAPRLENFQIGYHKQLTFSVPELVQFMERTENLRFDRARFYFDDDRVELQVDLPETNMPVAVFSIIVKCWHVDWQVSSMTQISNALSQIFFTVEHLNLEHEIHRWSSEEQNEVNHTEWLKLLQSFSNVKTLRIEDGLVRELSDCLRLEDREHPLKVLPELQELSYPASGNTDDVFNPFIDARQNAGRPVTLIRS